MEYEVVGPWAPIFCTGFFHYIVRDIETETEYCNVAFRSECEEDKIAAYKISLNIANLLNAAEEKK